MNIIGQDFFVLNKIFKNAQKCTYYERKKTFRQILSENPFVLSQFCAYFVEIPAVVYNRII